MNGSAVVTRAKPPKHISPIDMRELEGKVGAIASKFEEPLTCEGKKVDLLQRRRSSNREMDREQITGRLGKMTGDGHLGDSRSRSSSVASTPRKRLDQVGPDVQAIIQRMQMVVSGSPISPKSPRIPLSPYSPSRGSRDVTGSHPMNIAFVGNEAEEDEKLGDGEKIEKLQESEANHDKNDVKTEEELGDGSGESGSVRASSPDSVAAEGALGGDENRREVAQSNDADAGAFFRKSPYSERLKSRSTSTKAAPKPSVSRPETGKRSSPKDPISKDQSKEPKGKPVSKRSFGRSPSLGYLLSTKASTLKNHSSDLSLVTSSVLNSARSKQISIKASTNSSTKFAKKPKSLICTPSAVAAAFEKPPQKSLSIKKFKQMGDVKNCGAGEGAGGLREKFAIFSKFGDSSSDGTQITLSNCDKWMKQAGVIDGKKLTTTDTSIAFKKLAKTAKKINFEDFNKYVESLAASKKMEPKEILDKMAKCGAPALSSATKATSKGVVERLTDTSKYTGSHKERFDKDGKGKGIAGRKDVPDSSGYVNSFKEKLVLEKKETPSPVANK